MPACSARARDAATSHAMPGGPAGLAIRVGERCGPPAAAPFALSRITLARWESNPTSMHARAAAEADL
jgi:hypothetical protein